MRPIFNTRPSSSVGERSAWTYSWLRRIGYGSQHTWSRYVLAGGRWVRFCYVHTLPDAVRDEPRLSVDYRQGMRANIARGLARMRRSRAALLACEQPDGSMVFADDQLRYAWEAAPSQLPQALREVRR